MRLLGIGRLRDRTAPALKLPDHVAGKLGEGGGPKTHNPALRWVKIMLKIGGELGEGRSEGHHQQQQNQWRIVHL